MDEPSVASIEDSAATELASGPDPVQSIESPSDAGLPVRG